MPDNSPGQERLIRLSPGHAIKDFDCEDQDLNDFLLNESKNFASQLLAVTYILENNEETIAFFSVLNDKISVKEVGNPNIWSLIQRLLPARKSLKSYPAVKLGRVGVNKNHKKKGIGTSIISFLIDSFLSNNKTGCRFITVDAYSKSLAFYEKTGFEYLTEKDKGKDTRLMYLDLHPYKAQNV
jgi:predicted GNAT family N-acyltransferase